MRRRSSLISLEPDSHGLTPTHPGARIFIPDAGQPWDQCAPRYTRLGDDIASDNYFTTLAFLENLTWIKGKHTLKLGFETQGASRIREADRKLAAGGQWTRAARISATCCPAAATGTSGGSSTTRITPQFTVNLAFAL